MKLTTSEKAKQTENDLFKHSMISVEREPKDKLVSTPHSLVYYSFIGYQLFREK